MMRRSAMFLHGCQVVGGWRGQSRLRVTTAFSGIFSHAVLSKSNGIRPSLSEIIASPQTYIHSSRIFSKEIMSG